jgi:hypothetical protein
LSITVESGENGSLDVLMLSGDKPTLHPRLRERLAGLSARPITRIIWYLGNLLVSHD